jgi:hypothetical protein
VMLFFIGLPWTALVAADQVGELQARFDHENNSVRKAKLLEKLGDAQFDATRQASQAKDYPSVDLILEKYRDNARAAMNALKREHPDAERHTNGFKQLQMHIHRALRELDEALLVSPPEYKPPLELVRRDLVVMDDELLKMLFPRRLQEKKPEKSAIAPEKEKSSVGGSNPGLSPIGSNPSPALEKENTSTISLSTSPSPINSGRTPNPAPEKENTSTAISNPSAGPLSSSASPATSATSPSPTVSTTGLIDPSAPGQQKDYLSALEADKIRDAETTNERIKLFVTFAEDRLKKFQYELEHPSQNKHAEMLNALMNAYVGCVDDAADLIQLGIEKQENIRQGVDLMAGKLKEFLEALNKVSAQGTDIDLYKDNLDDAIEGTTDAIKDADKAKKNVAPPPVRRKN